MFISIFLSILLVHKPVDLLWKIMGPLMSAQITQEIIILKNKSYSNYKINKKTGISIGKIRRCLELSSDVTIKPRYIEPWKGPHKYIKYSFKNFKVRQMYAKQERAYNYAKHCEPLYLPFINYCKKLYSTTILGVKVKRSVDEYIKEFRKDLPTEIFPRRRWVYKMVHSHNYSFQRKWLPKRKWRKSLNKNKLGMSKPMKYNSIDLRQNKSLLRSTPNNFEIDSVIGKRTDKSALLTMIDIHTGKFYSAKYNRKAVGFAKTLAYIKKKNFLKINTLTMDNGGENNLLHTVVSKKKLYNCHPYCSGEKGTLESTHRILRRIIKKGRSIDFYTNKDIKIAVKFVNSYYSKTFNRVYFLYINQWIYFKK